jgi:tetratricopeptide (TPR) repeat protein
MNLPITLGQLESAQLIRHLVEAEPAYAFRHTLTQEFAYESLLKNPRREIHRAVAQAYEKIYADRCADEFAAILAQHYAEAGDEEQALIYATRAGDVAARVYASTEAIAFYTQAIEIATRRAENTAQLTHLFTRRGRAHELTGDYARAVENYGEMQKLAQTRGDRVLELEALMLQTTAYAVGSGGVRNLDKAQEFSAQALALAQELGDRKAQARIYWNLLLIHRLRPGAALQAIEYGEKSLALARELNLTEQIAFALKDLGLAYFIAGKAPLARANLPESMALWRQLNNIPMLAEALGTSGLANALEGKLDEALRLDEEAYALNQSIGNRVGLALAGASLYIIHRERGELGQAIALAEETVAIGESMNYIGPNWTTLVDLGMTYDWLGDYARAKQCAQRALASIVRDAATHPLFPRALLASVALHQGDRAAAEEMLAPYAVGSFDEYAQRIPSPSLLIATVATFIELALEQDDANRALNISDNAIQFVQKMGLTIFRPVTMHLRAKALKRLNRAEEAYALLLDAHQQAESAQLRYRLPPILFTLIEVEKERGDETQARVWRDEARAHIRFLAEHLSPDLRESFLNTADVRKVTTA